MSKTPNQKRVKVERVQLGVRMEKRLVKVLKAMAEYYDLSLGNLMEGMILHSMEGKSPFSDASIKRIEQFKQIYGMDFDSTAAHSLTEEE